MNNQISLSQIPAMNIINTLYQPRWYRHRNGWRLFICTIMLLAGLWLLFGISAMMASDALRSASLHTTGRVIENTWDVQAAHPVVEFYDRDERRVRFTDGLGTEPPDYAPGSTVTVLYRADDPTNAQIASWKRLWLFPTLLFSLAALHLIIAVICARVLRSTST